MRRIPLIALLLFGVAAASFANDSVERWGRFEVSFEASAKGNPFDVQVSAVFSNGTDKVEVRGFYDGDGTYKLRFMPQEEGTWSYITKSSLPALNRRKGTFDCVAPTGGNRGPVEVNPENRHAFSYADGTIYHPVGTTAYDWIHQSAERQEQTFSSLEAARFNKVRMCVFPKYYPLVHEEPDVFPFIRKGDGLDYSRPDPAFYRHLEGILDRMDALGVEADLILFHPYDKGHWGFDSLPMDVNLSYLAYLEARLSSFRNVWWSLANEYDYCKAKSLDDWTALIEAVHTGDPYGHLCSIHGSTAKYYPYWSDGLTHTSIQDEAPVEDFGRAAIVRNIYDMPIVFDEVCYEGNLASRWGRLSGQEMLHRMWLGLIAGTYVTHGECYQYEQGDFDDIFWAKGGEWRGESWKRIGFTRDVLAPLKRPLELADVSRDHHTATDGEGNYYIYLGASVSDSWLFDIPNKCASYAKPQAGDKYKVEIVDLWNMSVSKLSEVFTLGELNDYRFHDSQFRKIRLPLTPYLLLRLTKI